MALESGKVATGDTIQATDFNKLRNDLLTNHTHASGEGGTIDHKDLTETDDMSGMSHRHDDIDVHLNGGGPGPNAIDNPGGTMGVHGLASDQYLVGSLKGNSVAITGGIAAGGTSNTIPFGVTFATIVCIQLTPVTSGSGIQYELRITSYSTSSVSWASGTSLDGVHWLVVGTKA